MLSFWQNFLKHMSDTPRQNFQSNPRQNFQSTSCAVAVAATWKSVRILNEKNLKVRYERNRVFSALFPIRASERVYSNSCVEKLGLMIKERHLIKSGRNLAKIYRADFFRSNALK